MMDPESASVVIVVESGETIFERCVYLRNTKSGNECTIALSEHLSVFLEFLRVTRRDV